MTDKPTHAFPYNGEFYRHPGMELRDWFAGQALVGWLADGNEINPDNAAREAYAFADAMVAARKQQKGTGQ